MIEPFVRWAGGKRWLAPKLAAEIESHKPRLYVEPFVGGGAVALAIQQTIPKLLNDANPTLMDTWRCLQKSATTLIAELERVTREFPNTQKGYLDARSALNSAILDPRPLWFRRAALFLYINARCFNGLWRTNSEGFFNVPWGKLKKPSTIDVDEAAHLFAWLRPVTLTTMDFHELFHGKKLPWMQTCIYADPPYHDTFTTYTKGDFDEDAQRTLAWDLQLLTKKGAKVWVTNNDTPLVRELYAWAQIEEIDEHHCIGATGDRRGKRHCLLIRGIG